MDTLDLSDFFKTQSEARDFQSRITNVSKNVYQTNFNLEQGLMNELGLEKKDKFMALLRENNINSTRPDSLLEFLNKIQEKIASLPLISLTIAVEPTQETLKTISEWFVLNIKKQVVLEVKIDQSILGGAALLYNGKYLDYSIRPKFEEIFTVSLNPKSQNSQTQVAQPAIRQTPENMTFGR